MDNRECFVDALDDFCDLEGTGEDTVEPLLEQGVAFAFGEL